MSENELNYILDDVKANCWFNYSSKIIFTNFIIKKYRKKIECKSCLKRDKYLNKLFIEICDFLKLDYKFINFNLHSYPNNYVGPVGIFRKNSMIGVDITIYTSPYFTIENYITSMIHELSHYFIQYNDMDMIYDDEYSTDCLMVYLGFSDVMKKGYSSIKIESDDVFSNGKNIIVGYLTVDQIKYAEEYYKYSLNL